MLEGSQGAYLGSEVTYFSITAIIVISDVRGTVLISTSEGIVVDAHSATVRAWFLTPTLGGVVSLALAVITSHSHCILIDISGLIRELVDLLDSGSEELRIGLQYVVKSLIELLY